MACLPDAMPDARAHRAPHGPVDEPPEPDEQHGPIDPDDGESDEPAQSPERPPPSGKPAAFADVELLERRAGDGFTRRRPPQARLIVGSRTRQTARDLHSEALPGNVQ